MFVPTMNRRSQLNKTIPSDPNRSYIIDLKDFTLSVLPYSDTKLALQTMVRKLLITVANSGELAHYS